MSRKSSAEAQTSTKPLMPRATALWLFHNTHLTFEQIAEGCGMSLLEVQAIADGQGGLLRSEDPIANGQLTLEELERCQKDPQARLRFSYSLVSGMRRQGRYIQKNRRQDRPDGICWILKNYSTMSPWRISKLLGTTKKTVEEVLKKTHRLSATIKPRHPVTLGLCTMEELQEAVKGLTNTAEHATISPT